MAEKLLFVRTENLERSWPFVSERLMERLNVLGETQVVNVERDVPLSEAVDLKDVAAVALFGGKLSEACLTRAVHLKAVGGVLDNSGHSGRT